METNIINKNPQVVTEDVINALRGVYDPEIEFSIYDIGLIYEVLIDINIIKIIMTLTSFNCPEAQSLPTMVEEAVKSICPHLDVQVELTFEPEWSVENMADEIKLKLGLL